MILEDLREDFSKNVDFDPLEKIRIKKNESLPVDYFEFYNSVSSVYSSKLEGEELDFDSFYKYKFLQVAYQSDYTKRADDLLEAYRFIKNQPLMWGNLQKAHNLISANLLPPDQRGRIRTNPMYVINEADRIEYVACAPENLKLELRLFFERVEALILQEMSVTDVFYFASQLHLIFVKIHPFQDGNGRAARLLEKWFLQTKIGEDVVAIELEKNYYIKRKEYYSNIRALGLEYATLDYSKSLPFLLMTINSLSQ